MVEERYGNTTEARSYSLEKSFLIIAENRMAGKGTGSASHPAQPNLPVLCHLSKGLLSWVEQAPRTDPAL